ncbi:MAG TPA: heparan-alpha-glucosaminide N-acetyltransferase domain-containing protein [bacterium]|mgnify:CR=1 FL=1|nr:heparan-alpha-glucosaminide N-acetyltransferase domain-containing protein [bacterium]
MQAQTTPERIGYIDLLKGIACIIMLISHAMRIHIGDLSLPSRLWLMFHPPWAQVFFFASGMNIVLLMERYEKNKNFRMDRYYLTAAALLFFLGYTYSYARMALLTWQIFQGIAAATALTYVFLRTRLSTPVLLLIALAMYLIYLPFRLNIEPVLMWYRAVLPPGPPGSNLEALHSLQVMTSIGPVSRALFTNFSLLPWTSYVLIGAAAFRSLRRHPEQELRWWIGFGICFVAGFAVIWIPHGFEHGLWYVDQNIDAIYRHVPYHVLTAIGLCGLIWLSCHRWYKGVPGAKSKLKKFVYGYTEFLGVASFIFFIFHWFMLLLLMTVWEKMAAAGWVPTEMNIHLRWVVACIIVLPLMWPATQLGTLWSKGKSFTKQAWTLMGVSIFASLMLLARGHFRAGTLVAYGACFSYAFLYPVLRARLKKRCTVRPKKPRPAPSAA